MNNLLDRKIGCLVGLACGDAVGTTLEFRPRFTFQPITDMTGGGPFMLNSGEWTDDTSMALCLGYSLLDRGFDPIDQMKKYLDWYQTGYMSHNGKCFDIGNTTRMAIMNYRDRTEDAEFYGSTGVIDSGNGSLMRIAPVAIWGSELSPDALQECAINSSRVTHQSILCTESCAIFTRYLISAFTATNKDEISVGSYRTDSSLYDRYSKASFQYLKWEAQFASICDKSFLHLSYTDIQGTGYVMDSIIAALWCFFKSESFEEAILLAANLGDDADTTAAICGQIAGAYYGYSNIPNHWLDRLVWHDTIVLLAEDLATHNK